MIKKIISSIIFIFFLFSFFPKLPFVYSENNTWAKTYGTADSETLPYTTTLSNGRIAVAGNVHIAQDFVAVSFFILDSNGEIIDDTKKIFSFSSSV